MAIVWFYFFHENARNGNFFFSFYAIKCISLGSIHFGHYGINIESLIINCYNDVFSIHNIYIDAAL